MLANLFHRWSAPAFFALCIILGGASGRNAGVFANGVLQIAALLMILFVVWSRRGPLQPSARQLIWIGLAFAAAILVSLIPLPASVWQDLPGRAPIANGYELLGMSVPALPLSLAWHNSLASFLWLLPPAAMFLLTVYASTNARTRLMWTALALMAVSIVVGVAQLLGGPGSALYFYRVTNDLSPVGFFANTNHLATLLVSGLPLAGYLAGRSQSARGSRAQRGSKVMVAITIAIFLLAGIGTIGSLAGFGLTLPAAMAAFLIYRKAATGKVGRAWAAGLGILFILFLGLALAGPLSSQSLSGKIAGSPTSRGELAETTGKAIADFMPVGSGLGTLQEVYRAYDDPDRVMTEYVNHAHNDYLEIALELGVVGIALVLAFFAWWLIHAFTAWRADYQGSGLARAGSVIIFIVLLHSVVDYPVRTSAIAALFAVACGFLIPSSRASAPAPAKAGDESLVHLKA